MKTEALMVWLLAHTVKYPKYERFRLAKEIEMAIFNFHRCLIHATHASDIHPHLHQAEIHITELRAYMRIANLLKYTSDNQYGYFSENITEILKILRAWRKTQTSANITT